VEDIITKEIPTVLDEVRRRRLEMVRNQIKGRGITDPAVIRAISRVPRHLFVPEKYRDAAYSDQPLPIGYRQTISQPYIVAYMTENLQLSDQDRVLEIGTGSGYQTAVLAEIAKKVFTVEIIPGLAHRARQLFAALKYKNIVCRIGDGNSGWPEEALFDAIIVTAAAPEVPPPLIAQLKIGGRLIIPVGNFFQRLRLLVKTADGVREFRKIPVKFVPLTERQATKN